jgi:Beta-lactamase associated winged helix domain
VHALAQHHRQREASILAAVAAGAETVPDLVARVYVGLDPSLRRAAGLSTLAHLEDLGERGLILTDGDAFGEPRFRPA